MRLYVYAVSGIVIPGLFFLLAPDVIGSSAEWNEPRDQVIARFESTVEQHEFVAVLFYKDRATAQSLVEDFKRVHKLYSGKVFFIVADVGEIPSLRYVVDYLELGDSIPALLLFQDGSIIKNDVKKSKPERAILTSPLSYETMKKFMNRNLKDRITRVTYEKTYPRNDASTSKDSWAQNNLKCDQLDPWFYWNYPYTRGYRGGKCGPGIGGGSYW